MRPDAHEEVFREHSSPTPKEDDAEGEGENDVEVACTMCSMGSNSARDTTAWRAGMVAEEK